MNPDEQGLGTSFAFLPWETDVGPHGVDTFEGAMDEFVSDPEWFPWLTANVPPVWEFSRSMNVEDRNDFKVVIRKTSWSCYVPAADLSKDERVLRRQFALCLRRFYSVAARRAGLTPTPAFDDVWPI